MRWMLVVAAAIAACTHPQSGPQWPTQEIRLPDGGESLAPRPGGRAIVAATVEEEGDAAAEMPKPAAEIKLAPTIEPKADPSKPAATEDPVILEETIIEIDGD
jgi:hypothetical protein